MAGRGIVPRRRRLGAMAERGNHEVGREHGGLPSRHGALRGVQCRVCELERDRSSLRRKHRAWRGGSQAGGRPEEIEGPGLARRTKCVFGALLQELERARLLTSERRPISVPVPGGGKKDGVERGHGRVREVHKLAQFLCCECGLERASTADDGDVLDSRVAEDGKYRGRDVVVGEMRGRSEQHACDV
ncbi:hypothetical protein GSI_05370 [Ganoderma sinense ZZ0214-1]|uniref:Uncharacterized protein n=1 Tax=Ganoderma sinense ZZ0214-1 TaxID=1077348 RepID=A0A2G8SFX3_9APHY|nr:hypothetical protein GSI_05370 [Ganoderma sinense ZZ0214-1]